MRAREVKKSYAFGAAPDNWLDVPLLCHMLSKGCPAPCIVLQGANHHVMLWTGFLTGMSYAANVLGVPQDGSRKLAVSKLPERGISCIMPWLITEGTYL